MTTVKVLLVEDHPTWQKILRDDVQDALRKTNALGEIEIVETYDEACLWLEKEEWHLLVTDIGLGSPSESLQKLGIRLVKLAYEHQIPAIAVSGTSHLQPQDVRKLFKEVGASDFFSKQEFDDTKFIETVQTLLKNAEQQTLSKTSFPASITKILFLSTRSDRTSHSHLEQEVRDITEGLKLAKKRDHFILEAHWAVPASQIQRAMLDSQPQIVQFSGQGAGLAFEDEAGQVQQLSSQTLAGLFKLFANQVQCVVLNGCYAVEQAKAIAQHISYVVGTSQSTEPKASTAFAVGFYDALGAGCSIELAYEFGCSAIQLAGLGESSLPQITRHLSIVHY